MNGSWIRVLSAASVLAAIAVILANPASADERHRDRDRDRRPPPRYHHVWRPAPGYGYVAPAPVYAPPAVIYAPPPTPVYAPPLVPSVNLQFRF